MRGAAAVQAAWLLAVSLQLLLAPQQASAASQALTAADAADQSLFKPMFVLVGDSITEFSFEEGGWGIQLAELYKRKADVINRGFGGYNTRMGLFVLDEFMNSFGAGRIKLVTLCFGANDASSPNGIGGYLHVSLSEFKANLEAMIKKLKSKGIRNIVIMTPPPVVDRMVRKSDGTLAPTPTQADMKQYAAAAMGVASQQGVPSVDVFNIILKFKNWQTAALSGDGRHLTYLGQKAVYDGLMYVINNNLRSISIGSLPNHMPNYREVDARYPADTFNSLYGYKINTGVQLPPSAPTPAPATAVRTWEQIMPVLLPHEADTLCMLF
ncbi:hypothetical protein OEZ86_002081 [Tetradesmus obliquus]|nr:hypothetical protein OEZ86_002081 [Tetradesmus obliquus]